MYPLLHLIIEQIFYAIKMDNSVQGQMFFLHFLAHATYSSVKSAGEEEDKVETDLCKPAS